MDLDDFSSKDATHYLWCSHCVGGRRRRYRQRCIVLKEMDRLRVKVVVFGDRYWKDTAQVKRIRYVMKKRVEKIQESTPPEQDGGQAVPAAGETLRDDDGRSVGAGDTVRFTYGIPPRTVYARIVERDGKLIGLCPGHRPAEFNLRSLRRNVDCWYRSEPVLVYLATPYSHPDAEVREDRFREVNRVAGDMMCRG